MIQETNVLDSFNSFIQSGSIIAHNVILISHLNSKHDNMVSLQCNITIGSRQDH